ncbi:hypothetical protein [Leclercia adecarboxylata]|nr:hypothetical protein [Leclercia adecarboxylata]
MAVETYNWRSQLGAGPVEYSQALRAAQFGDGYEQVAALLLKSGNYPAVW